MFILDFLEKLWEQVLSLKIFRWLHLELSASLCIIALAVSCFNVFETSSDSYQHDKILRNSAEMLRKDIQFVQIMAAKDHENLWAIKFLPGSYTLIKNGRKASEEMPSGGSEVQLGDCLFTLGLGELKFDRWGSPVNGEDYQLTMSNQIGEENVYVYAQTPEFSKFMDR